MSCISIIAKFSSLQVKQLHQARKELGVPDILSLLLLPARLVLGVPFYLYGTIFGRGSRSPATNPGRLQNSHMHAAKKALDNVVQRATDRRSGVIEDIHF